MRCLYALISTWARLRSCSLRTMQSICAVTWCDILLRMRRIQLRQSAAVVDISFTSQSFFTFWCQMCKRLVRLYPPRYFIFPVFERNRRYEYLVSDTFQGRIFLVFGFFPFLSYEYFGQSLKVCFQKSVSCFQIRADPLFFIFIFNFRGKEKLRSLILYKAMIARFSSTSIIRYHIIYKYR